MTNIHRFLAFSQIDGAVLGWGATVEEARVNGAWCTRGDDAFVEIIDAGADGLAIINRWQPLYRCRHLPTVFHGAGFDRPAP